MYLNCKNYIENGLLYLCKCRKIPVLLIFNIGGYIFTRVGSYNRGKNKNIMCGGMFLGNINLNQRFQKVKLCLNRVVGTFFGLTSQKFKNERVIFRFENGKFSSSLAGQSSK